MSPDNDNLQNKSPLPEVPQIPTSEPPVSPTDQPAVITPEVPSVIMPAAAEMPPSPAPSAFNSPTTPPVSPQQPDVAPPAPVTQPTFNQLSVTPVTPRPEMSSVVPGNPAKKGLGLGAILGIVGGLIVVAGGVIGVLFLLGFMNQGKVSEADLVTSTTTETSYLRPKQWSQVSTSGIDGYGNKVAKDDKSTAAIFVKKISYYKSGIKSVSDSQVTAFRDAMVKANSGSTAENELKTTGECSEVKTVKTTASANNNAKSIGVFTVTGTCVKDGANFHIVYYALLGDDGYGRTIILIATEESWKLNETIFNKMIDSADQS